ncbi:MAG: hypothetical protein M3R04_06125 [bacterium]|nr:hypothetical protein [bacterium]
MIGVPVALVTTQANYSLTLSDLTSALNDLPMPVDSATGDYDGIAVKIALQ